MEKAEKRERTNVVCSSKNKFVCIGVQVFKSKRMLRIKKSKSKSWRRKRSLVNLEILGNELFGIDRGNAMASIHKSFCHRATFQMLFATNDFITIEKCSLYFEILEASKETYCKIFSTHYLDKDLSIYLSPTFL